MEPASPPDRPPADSGPSLALKLGVAAVIGAVASNIIGFRFSRWAVGKELHRAWERRAAFQRARAAVSSKPSWGRASSSPVYGQRPATGHVPPDSSGGKRPGAEAGGSDEADFEEFIRNMSRRSPGRGRSGGGSGQADFEELLRSMSRGSTRGGGGGSAGNVFRDIENLIREAERVAKSHGGFTYTRTSSGTEGFGDWEEAFRQAGGQGSRGGGGSARGGTVGGFGGGGRDRALATLGLKSNATAAEVKTAFRAKARKYHPDTTSLPADVASEKFREVSRAYGELSGKR